MKVLIFAFVLALCLCQYDYNEDKPVIDQTIIDRLKNSKNLPWKFTENINENPFRHWTKGQVSDWLGTYGPLNNDHDSSAPYVNADLPEKFDWMDEYPECVHGVLDQQHCGSCWAFGATEALSDRFCIDSKKAIDVVLSAQYMVSCDTADYACQGGRLGSAWDFMQDEGCPVDACMPYVSGDGTTIPSCPTKCEDGSVFKTYQCGEVNHVTKFIYPIKDKMKEELMKGPIEGRFTVYQDFMAYKSGVYVHETGSMLGGNQNAN